MGTTNSGHQPVAGSTKTDSQIGVSAARSPSLVHCAHNWHRNQGFRQSTTTGECGLQGVGRELALPAADAPGIHMHEIGGLVVADTATLQRDRGVPQPCGRHSFQAHVDGLAQQMLALRETKN